jgi:purine-nucleoside phosphorylase
MVNLNAKYLEIVKEVLKQVPFEPEICIVLGSGLGNFAEKIETIKSVATSSLSNYPNLTVRGHQGCLHFSNYGGKKLLVIQGRIHFYEGHSLSQCVLPVHIAAKLGCKKILLTNAAGGVNPFFIPGNLMLAHSFNGSIIWREFAELVGLVTLEQKNSALDLPSKEMNESIVNAALCEKISLYEGLYWMTMGPSYETAAEIKMYRKYGADAVGMSTVPEVYYASYLGMKVASISCITNFAAGLSTRALSHDEVMETSSRVMDNFEKLLKKSIELF